MDATYDIDQVPATGVLLAAPLRDEDGQLLLPEGASLSHETIARLRQRGVRSLAVRAAAARPASGDAGKGAQLRLQHLFRFALAAGQVNPLLHILQRLRTGELG